MTLFNTQGLDFSREWISHPPRLEWADLMGLEGGVVNGYVEGY